MLLLYVLVPPISDAIQGAYFVAAFVPAIGIGGLALIFKDMVEGVGCAVGGFSLAMFFLVLKEGGLLTNTVSKSIFIGCWTAGLYALYFSHYLRGYVLIGGTSLGGATAIILGIDCFALAGLKEFWVYIWALNGKLFPPLQDTFPITHGMHAEIAGIVVLTFFGVLSQLRIWRIVQARRQKKEVDKSEEERLRDEAEAELGRAVQSGQEEERKEWERVYNDDSGKKQGSVVNTEVSSVYKGSESLSIKDRDTIKLGLSGATAKSQRSSVDSRKQDRSIVVPIAEDDITPAMSDDTQTASPFWSVGPPSSGATSVSPADPPTKAYTQHEGSGLELVPLPFQIPIERSLEHDQEEGESLAALVDDKDVSSHRRSLQGQGQANFSRPTIFRSFSNKLKRFSVGSTSSVEALDDDASRKARTSFLGTLSFEDQPDISIMLSEIASQVSGSVDTDAIPKDAPLGAQDYGKKDDLAKEGCQHWPLQSEKRDSMDSVQKLSYASQPLSLPKSTEFVHDESPVQLASPAMGTARMDGEDKSRATSGVAEIEKEEHITEEKPSKVVMQFRTNEWAKHLETAEKPSLEELVSYASTTEKPANLVQEELLQTPLTAQPVPAQVEALESKPKAKVSKSTKAKQSPAQVPNLAVENPSGSQQPAPIRTSSSSSSLSYYRASPMHSDPNRYSQRPYLHPSIRASSSSLLASPIAEDSVTSFPPIPSPSPRPPRSPRRSGTGPGPNLTQSNGRSQQTSRNISPMSSNSDITAALSNDNLPLSKRKSYLHQNSTLNLATDGRRVSSNPVPRTTAHLKNSPQRQQTHPQPNNQPYAIPDHTIQRASMLAEWRRSKALEQSQLGSRNTSASGIGNIPNYAPPDQGPVAPTRIQSMDPAASWGSYSPLGGTGINMTASRGSQGMVDSTIYGRDRSRRASAMTAREVDQAHREVLRRMQAGANRALKADSLGS